MTLPCDASRQIYPENRAGKYTTVLAREIVLDGEYEVGLSECVIPVPKSSLNFKQQMIINELGAGFRFVPVDAREMSSMTDLEYLDVPKTREGVAAFKLSVRERRVVLSVAAGCMILFREDNKDLANLLGFPLKTYIGGTEKVPYNDYIAPNPFGGSGTLFFIYIYCDVVEYSFVGDSMVPCLRTLSVVSDETKSTVLRFENPHYTPVSQSRFSQISIEIANDQGEEIIFSKGLSLVKLHFRPKKK